MRIIVQKFGGTSVADAQCIRKAAQKILKAREQGYHVVATVSARAGMTDQLIALARSITPNPHPRELDMLLATGEQASIALMCMTLHSMGQEAISFTGAQVGIRTDSVHTNARIRSIDTDIILRELNAGRVVVVAGFQGIGPDSNITTLGRGAGDLTAVALAAALHADLCEIYTDVDGVYTADPRIVPDAIKLNAINHDEILELAGRGAKVLQSRCVEVAKKFRVPLSVRSTFTDNPGTIVCSEVRGLENSPVTGTAICRQKSKIMFKGIPNKIGIAANIVSAIGKQDIVLDTLIQTFPADGVADISLLVAKADLPLALATSKIVGAELGASEVYSEDSIARVSIVGHSMTRHHGVAADLCEALAEHNINITMITTSEIHVSVVVENKDAEKALVAAHEKFNLALLPPSEAVLNGKAQRIAAIAANGEKNHNGANGVEDFQAESIECDRDQAELKVVKLADKPGSAARLLRTLANAQINLDVVLQNSCSSGISITMKRKDVERAKKVIEAMEEPITKFPIHVSSDIAKVSISGAGLKQFAGAASKICGVFAREGIDIKMIGTSEAMFTTVVADADADRAVKLLKAEFNL